MSAVVTVSSLVEFLLSLLRDPEKRAEFEQNPDAVLARNGLDGLCSTDVTDAVPLLADRSGVQASPSEPVVVQSGPAVVESGGSAPVQEITHVTNNYEVDKSVEPDESDVYNIHNVDDRDQIINVDDRDTTTIQAAGDVNIDDSFNQDNDAAIVNDSYNQDNDGLDNKGGTIDDSNAGGGGSINVGNDAGSVSDDSAEDSVDEPEDEPTTGTTMTAEDGTSQDTIDVEAGSGETLSSDEGTSEQTLHSSTTDDAEPDPAAESV